MPRRASIASPGDKPMTDEQKELEELRKLKAQLEKAEKEKAEKAEKRKKSAEKRRRRSSLEPVPEQSISMADALDKSFDLEDTGATKKAMETGGASDSEDDDISEEEAMPPLKEHKGKVLVSPFVKVKKRARKGDDVDDDQPEAKTPKSEEKKAQLNKEILSKRAKLTSLVGKYKDARESEVERNTNYKTSQQEYFSCARMKKSKLMENMLSDILDSIIEHKDELATIKWIEKNKKPRFKNYKKDDNGKKIKDEKGQSVWEESDGYLDARIEVDALHKFAEILRITADFVDTKNVKAEAIKDEAAKLQHEINDLEVEKMNLFNSDLSKFFDFEADGLLTKQ